MVLSWFLYLCLCLPVFGTLPSLVPCPLTLHTLPTYRLVSRFSPWSLLCAGPAPSGSCFLCLSRCILFLNVPLKLCLCSYDKPISGLYQCTFIFVLQTKWILSSLLVSFLFYLLYLYSFFVYRQGCARLSCPYL